ncbi:MAG TPA: tRNA lysidine(34) synthetase TilS, partial [Tepidisphaeraceae bacterium]|jgi:tRNA(Ile)-lysidine synthetase-like protein|nr:tRNA lysidine(34) synthetase TilS [Tepidisphaeraceae bacterium]
MQKSFEDSLAKIPEGQYAVGVSGGADSVGLLRLVMKWRPDVGVHVVHLNHELRGEESEEDAVFVRELAERHRLPVTIARRSEIEPMLAKRPANKSALYRVVRFLLFKKVVREHGLHGVMLAHHADDQAETVLHRLLRGSGAAGLGGMARESRQGMLSVLRPLLGHGREEIREYLKSIGQEWREDLSNQSGEYLRNRLRGVLSSAPQLSAGLVEMAREMRGMRKWVAQNAPVLPERFAAVELGGWPEVLAMEAGRKWLIGRGAPAGELRPRVLERFVEFVTDAGLGTRQEFPGRVKVRRRRGWVEVE